MEKYKDSDVELMSILLKLQEQTSPIRMSIGYTVGGTVRQGIILYEAAPKVIETLIEKGWVGIMFGDVNVKVEDGNLGRSSSTGTGTSIKIGISNVESKSPILISGTMNAKKIKEKVGNTPLADACIDAVEWGASSIYCIPVKAGTAGTIGKITEDKKGYGTFEVKGSPNNAYDIVVEVMDAGECNEGSFRYSLDGGNTFTEEMTIPITGEAELATTGLTAKFTDAEGGDSFMEGDRFTFSSTSPAMSNESVISAVESLINSPLMFEFVHIVGVSSKALWASLCTIANDFLTK